MPAYLLSNHYNYNTFKFCNVSTQLMAIGIQNCAPTSISADTKKIQRNVVGAEKISLFYKLYRLKLHTMATKKNRTISQLQISIHFQDNAYLNESISSKWKHR